VRFIDGEAVAKLIGTHLVSYATGDIARIDQLVKRDYPRSPQLLAACNRAHSHLHVLNVAVHNTLIAFLPDQQLLDQVFADGQLEQLVFRVIEAYRSPATFKRVTITPHVDAAVSIPMDETALMLALSNLMDNAVKYAANGSDILVRVQHCGSKVLLEFENHGPWIPPDEIDRIWEPYFRCSAVTRFDAYVPGVGLGLAVARKAVELHEGTIEARSVLLSESDPRVAANRFAVILPTRRNRDLR